MQTLTFNNYIISILEKSDTLSSESYFSCKQTHSTNIYLWESGPFLPQEADGIITNQVDQSIAVRIADCNAIILMGKEYFAIIHAGRRGLYAGILEKAIKIMKSKGEEDMKMYIGPSIRACCYEVGPEFTEYFDKKYLISKGEKLYLDMLSNIQDRAKGLGIQDIIAHPDCTHCSENYRSYRRGDKEKRNIVAIKKIF